jgi:hypothetical protein
MPDQNSHLIHPTRLEKLKKIGDSAKRAAALMLLATGMSAGGCSTLGNLEQNLKYNDSFSEWVVGQRDSAWAAKAWHLRKHHFCNERYLKDFSEGFRAGYADVAGGSNGCTPAFPQQTQMYPLPESNPGAAFSSGAAVGANGTTVPPLPGASSVQGAIGDAVPGVGVAPILNSPIQNP